MTKFHSQLILLSILLALALTGCAATSRDETSAAESEQAAQAAEELAAPTAEPTATVIEEPTVATEPTLVVEPSPTEELESTGVALGPPPAFTEDMHATDPQTVTLGAGRPQMIEFFAFW